MTLTSTLVVLGLAAALAGFANYKVRQPSEPGRPRWVPYLGLQFVGLLLVVLMLAHLVTLLTGTPLIGRLSR
jgi:hypothetical protein